MVSSLGLESSDENKTAMMFKVKTVSLNNCVDIKQKERKESKMTINAPLRDWRNDGGRSQKA